MTEVDYEKQLKELQREYVAELGTRFSKMQAAVAQMQNVAEAENALRDLFRLVHSLAGSAGSFGFASLSQEARSLEATLRGYIRAADLPDANACAAFSLTLKRLQRLAGGAPDTAARADAGTTISSRRPAHTSVADKPNRLLVLVDPQGDITPEISPLLELKGYRVSHLPAHAELELFLAQNTPSLLLVDLLNSEGSLTGADTISALRRTCAHLPPVIFFSSRGDWTARVAAVRADGKALLSKPVDALDVLEVVQNHLPQDQHEPFRVLIVDDTEELAERYALVLEAAGMQAVALSDPTQTLKTLVQLKPDLVLMDLYMPEVHGMEVASILRQHPDLQSIPIVFLSTEQNRDIQLLALRQGDEFIAKPISDKQLIAAVSARAVRARALSRLMYRDRLTGLLGCTALRHQLDIELPGAQTRAEPLSVAIVNLDLMGELNRMYGPANGDLVLSSLAGLLNDNLGNNAQAGRLGSDEFMLILPNMDLGAARDRLESLRCRFAAMAFSKDGARYNCTFSCGIAQASAADSPKELYQLALKALRQAKNAGRNQVATAPR